MVDKLFQFIAKMLTCLPIANGGTGATTAAKALTNLGITATAAELNKLDGVTATTAELNRVDGVTSDIQTQLNGKLGSTATAAAATKLATARTIDGVSFNGSAAIAHYGTCSTAAATAAKAVSLSGFSLVTGAVVFVKFTVTNTAASPTLNVNSTGAKAIHYRGAAISAGYLAANRIYAFVYDGSYWQFIGDLDTNTTALTAMTGTLSIAKGGTGATSISGILQTLFPTGATATYIPVFGSSWKNYGYVSLASLANAMVSSTTITAFENAGYPIT